MWFSRRPSAMTLAEVMVYCVLLSLFSVMLFVALPSKSNSSVEDLHEATSRANVALTELSLDLGNASAASVVVSKDPAGILFLVAGNDLSQSFTYLSSGDLAWKGWVGYFWRGSDLLRVWYPLKAETTKSTAGSPPLIAEMLKSGTSQVACPGVTQFSVTPADNNLWQFQLGITVGNSSANLSSGAGARN